MEARDVWSLALIVAIGFTVACWWRLPKQRGPLFVTAGWLFHAALVLEAAGLAARMSGMNNNILYNLFQPFEFIMILMMIRATEPSLHRTVLWVCGLGVLIFIGALAFQGTLELLSTDGILALGVLLTFLLARTLFLLARNSRVPLQRNSVFWLYLGCFLYFAGVVPVLGGIRLAYSHHPDLALSLWKVIPLLAIVRYLLMTWACLLSRIAP